MSSSESLKTAFRQLMLIESGEASFEALPRESRAMLEFLDRDLFDEPSFHLQVNRLVNRAYEHELTIGDMNVAGDGRRDLNLDMFLEVSHEMLQEYHETKHLLQVTGELYEVYMLKPTDFSINDNNRKFSEKPSQI